MFFDVDFTLIQPGPRFEGTGYAETCRRHGVEVDPDRFTDAVAAAVGLLDASDRRYDHEVFITYTGRIIEGMGGQGDGVTVAAREIYDAWAEHQHFELYDDVVSTLRGLHARGLRLGLISNSHRCLSSFQTHFLLDGLVSVAVSSSEFGLMKPDPRIFQEALMQMAVPAHRAVMVGDSVAHDIEGARQVGMRGVLIDRAARTSPDDAEVDVIRSLSELSAIL